MTSFRRSRATRRPNIARLGSWLAIAAVSLLLQACEQPSGPAFEDEPGPAARATAEPPGIVRLTTGPLDAVPSAAQPAPGGMTVSTGAMPAGVLSLAPGPQSISTGPAPVSSPTAGPVGESRIETPGTDLSSTAGSGTVGALSVGLADIEVTKTSSVPQAKVGDVIEYTLTVRNNGPDAATTVTASDVLPASVTFATFVSLDAPAATVCTHVAGTVSCTAATLPSGEEFVLVFRVTAVTPGITTNTATGGSAVDDPVPGNNSGSAVTEILPLEADIEVTKTSSVPQVLLGHDFNYTMTVRNNGPDAATTVTLEDVLPASITFVSFVSLNGPAGVVCVFASGTVNCTAAALQPGEQFVLTMTVKATSLGLVTNTATAGSATDDPVAGNNTTAAETLVIGEGCGIGFWKNWPSAWSGTGYTPAQTVGSVFSNSGRAGRTLAEALASMGGNGVQGGKDILLRAAVAALLNAAHPDVEYPLTAAEVLTQVNAALAEGRRGVMLGLAGTLDGYNNLGCPIP